MVVLVLAIVSAVVIPSGRIPGPEHLRAAADVLMADMSLARSLAVTEGQPYRVIFDADGDTYRIVRVAGGPVAGRPLASGEEGIVLRLSDVPSAGRYVRIAGVGPQLVTGQQSIEFTPLGGLASRKDATITLELRDPTHPWRVKITVSAVTGLCRVGSCYVD